MGFYIRKSFRAGPIRFNLSKSGVGISGGVTGARVGVGPRGAYVHGGRHGLYYRRSLSASGSRPITAQTFSQVQTNPAATDFGCARLFGTVSVILAGIAVLLWFVANPVALAPLMVAGVVIGSFVWKRIRHSRRQREQYRNALRAAFMDGSHAPCDETLTSIQQLRAGLPDDQAAQTAVLQIEADVYRSVLSQVLDDGVVTPEESCRLQAIEKIIRLPDAQRLQPKIDVFLTAFSEAIADRHIDDAELKRIYNLREGLSIPQDKIARELALVQEFVDTQNLSLPFPEIPREGLEPFVHNNEKVLFQCPAKVLSRRKSPHSPTGYEHTVRRTGTLILTDRRLRVVGDGTTRVDYSQIADIDVDLDEGLVVVSKTNSGRPALLRTDAPFYLARALDLLVHQPRNR